ncbi:MAG TPA: hypothetical protein VGS12_05405 [Caulobacteraceae bacterium]|nr:hypothetical protein [Caulobacteraceae bacterium]
MTQPPGDRRTSLSRHELAALANLSRKDGGAEVGWIGIAAARRLTDLGLAERTRSGWRITPAGEAVFQATGRTDATQTHTVLFFPSHPHRAGHDFARRP